MKIAITKIGANITFSANNGSAANADILYALRAMKGFGHKFTAVTHKTRNTELPDAIALQEVNRTQDFNSFDLVLVFNGSINFFGGHPDEALFSLYRALSKTTKPIVYVQTDGALFFRQLWPLIQSREWASTLSEGEFYVEPANVYYISQGRINAKTLARLRSEANAIEPIGLYHYPWEKTILADYERVMNTPLLEYNERKYDLGFGGYIRNNHKQKRIENYYDDPTLNVLLFGNLRGIKLQHTEVQPKVSYQQMIPKMSNCKATVIVGDLYYNDHFHTLRMYESILAGNLVLIDKMMDTKAEFYKGLYDPYWFLVESKEEVREKLKTCAVGPEDEILLNVRNHIIESFENDRMKDKLNTILESICQGHQ